MHFRKMVGSKCYLSPIAEEDTDVFAEWHNDLEVAIPLGYAHVASSEQREKKRLKGRMEKNPHAFSVLEIKTDKLIGMVNLHGVDHINRRAFLGIVIGEKEYWNRGFGTEAIKLILDYGFNILNLHNIGLGVIAFNEQAIACYRKVGFKEAARKRKSKIMMGKTHDVVIMDILASEFDSDFVRNIVAAGNRGVTDASS